MMRVVDVKDLENEIADMCIMANHFLSKDMELAIHKAREDETSVLGQRILVQLEDNLEIAGKRMIPICQDTGMAVIFLSIGQDVHFTGGNLTEAINRGVARGYEEGYLRKSVVGDPIQRVNTNNNTPAIIHTQIVEGESIEITLTPKGFGSENMSKIYMLKPADGIDGIKKAVIETVANAGPNACPPLVVGVGIGGDFEYSAILAKKALTRETGSHSSLEHIAQIERELLKEINQLGIGPAGLGGGVTALAVQIETFPTHIAGLPVAINLCCHVNRHVTRRI